MEFSWLIQLCAAQFCRLVQLYSVELYSVELSETDKLQKTNSYNK